MNPLLLFFGLFGAGAATARFGKAKSTDDGTLTGGPKDSARGPGDSTFAGPPVKDDTPDDPETSDDAVSGGDDALTGGDTLARDDSPAAGDDDTMDGGDDTTTGAEDTLDDTMPAGGDTTAGADDPMSGDGAMGGGDGTMDGGDHTHDDGTATGGDTTAGADDTMSGDGAMGGDDGAMDGGDHTHDDGATAGGGTMDGGDHGDHTPPDIPPPGVGASQAEIDAYLDALAAADEAHIHDTSSSKAGEHDATMNLAPRGDATHVAIGDGDWFDPSIWSNGEVPGDDARVLIPDGVTVDYGQVSDARLFTVRVDGKLEFATDADSQMIFDTFLVAPSGHLVIGTEADPVQPNVDVDLIVANNGPIDTNWDPMLLSRGLVSHGETTIHGAEKDSHDKVTDDPMAGDTSVKFAGAPEGWQIGDTIVIAGTHYDGYKWDNDVKDVIHHESEDEVRVITQIDADGTVWFDTPLAHDHDTPRDDLFTSVANYTRNVSIETEDPETAEVFERGHVMFMHSDDVDVRYMEFHELGRTDKSVESFDISDIGSVSSDSNVQGRYALHLHRTGVSDPDDPTILEGNAVYGSPGWGVVHHDSNAVITNNATFDTFGAGFVAETGNEIGAWVDNIAIYATGVSWGIPKNNANFDDGNFDTANGGEGFWFQGRLVESIDNVAASVNTGFVYFHREGDSGRMIDFDAALFDYPYALHLDDTVSPDDAPILSFDGNEAFAAKEGLHVVKANTEQNHDVWTHLNDFTAWSVKTGVHLQYTSHYILSDFDLVGKEDTAFSPADEGILFGTNLSEIVIIDSSISGFDVGIDLTKDFVRSTDSPTLHDYVVIDTEITDVNRTFDNYDPSLDLVTSRTSLPGHDPDLSIDGPLTFNDGNIGLTGTKTDGIGTTEFPGGIDNYDLLRTDVIRILENTGYWTTDSGQAYTLLDIYFTDRLTGEIYYETHPVYISDGVPLGSATAAGGRYANVVDNGIQNIVGQMAGDYALDTPIAAEPVTTVTTLASTTPELQEQHVTFTETAMADEIWMDGYDGGDALSIGVSEGLFVNTGDMGNTDLAATGGATVLAADGAEFDLDAGRTLAVSGAGAEIGFDGDDGGIAILDMHEDAQLIFGSEDGDLGTIAEFHSGAFGDAPDVNSGIDLGGATISIDLSGLSADAGTAFTLMDADEIMGLFNDATVDGLGARDARIVIDYGTDSVTLELSAGTGAVSVETQGDAANVTPGDEALWAALTMDQGVMSDTEAGLPLDEEELLDNAA